MRVSAFGSALEHLKLAEVGWRLPPGVSPGVRLHWRETPEAEDGLTLNVGCCAVGWECFDGGKQGWTDLTRLRAGAMAELHGLVYGPDRPEPLTDSRHIVAYDAGRAVGYVTAEGRAFDELASGYVRPSHRGQGLATLLLGEAMRRFPLSSIQVPVSAGGEAVAALVGPVPAGDSAWRREEAAALEVLSKMAADEHRGLLLSRLGVES